MPIERKQAITVLLFSSALSASAWAAVSAEEAAQLGGSVLTQWGAERAGNKEGTIPAYSGERVKAPAEYNPKEPMQLPSPFKGEKPLFTITAQNMDKYADKLTEGQKALLKAYPKFHMDIYPSHRTAFFPKYVLDNTVRNATACKGVQNELVLKGCYGGFPFPIPKTGNQAMWNHLTRYEGQGVHIVTDTYSIDSNGKPALQGTNDAHQTYPMHFESDKPLPDNAIYWKLRFDQTDPPRVSGQKYVIIDALDSVNIGRRSYAYIPGQRRVKLAPDLQYDTPSPVSGGIITMDATMLFLGAQDRYDIKLIGKTEKYILYNNYELFDYKTCPNEKQLTKHFLNPDCSRWELHRVWELHLTLKPGFRHVLPKRTIYFDEDNWGSGASDDYDSSGKLWRVGNQPSIHLYASKQFGNQAGCTTVNDLQTGSWYLNCTAGRPGLGLETETPKPETFYTPEALAGEGIR